jgi:hypothetical protein
MKSLRCAALALLMATAPAKAFTTGELYQRCTSNTPIEEGYCIGYVAAIWDKLPCGGTATNRALIQAFKNWAEKHPEKWTDPEGVGAELAFRSTWKCE